MIRLYCTMVLGFGLTACATVPDAVVQYYPPKAKLTMAVTQAVDCTADKTALVTSNSIADPVAYSADRAAPVRQFRIRQPAGSLADTNLTFNLTDDGRLKSVNGDSTGQVEAVAKAVITAAVALVPLIGGGAPTPPAGQLGECTTIASWGGGKPVTLTYTQDVLFASDAAKGPFLLRPDAGSAALYEKLKAQLPRLLLTVAPPVPIERAVFLSEQAHAGPKLVLNRTGAVHLTVAEAGKDNWSGDIVVPMAETFDVPLPKGAAFGKVSFAVTLADSGAITTLTYGQVSGAAGPANVAAAAATGAKPATAADRAAVLKGEADEIAQNARVAKCRADPTNCT